MAESRPSEGLRMIAYRAARDWATEHRHPQPDDRMVNAVLAALFDACTVSENPHMWLGDGTRGGRSLVLRFPLPDEPMPEPGPMPPELAEALERARAAVSSTGEEKTDRG